MHRSRISVIQLATSLTIVLLTTTSWAQSATDRTFVTPRSIAAKEPFTFAAQGVVEGEVIEVQTVEGEVISSHKPDSLGRVFLESGLAAGSYLLAAGGHRHPALTRLKVVDQVATSPRPCELFKLDELVRLGSQTNHPDARDLSAKLDTGTNIPVLAASSHEVVLAAPKTIGIKPGHYSLSVKDSQGQTIVEQPAALCQVIVNLMQDKVLSGASTSLVFTMTPKDVAADLLVSILSGPITFQQGAKETTMSLRDGTAMVPVQTLAGQSGRFAIGWMFSPNRQVPSAHPIRGDTEVSKEPEWIPFEDADGRKGKVQVTESEGFRREKKIYDDGGSTLVTTRTGQNRKTEDTETTTKVDGVETQVVEHREWIKDKATGEWKFKSGTKTSDTYGPGHKVVDTKTEKLRK